MATDSGEGTSAGTGAFGALSASESLQNEAGQLSHVAEQQDIERAAADPTVWDINPKSAISAAIRRRGIRKGQPEQAIPAFPEPPARAGRCRLSPCGS